MPDAVRFFTRNRRVTAGVYSMALEEAQKNRRMEIVALLLDYRKDMPPENPMARFNI